MSPERIGQSNMWRLFKGEFVAGLGGKIKGPRVVTVEEFVVEELLLVKGGQTRIQLEGTDFEAKVRNIEANA